MRTRTEAVSTIRIRILRAGRIPVQLNVAVVLLRNSREIPTNVLHRIITHNGFPEEERIVRLAALGVVGQAGVVVDVHISVQEQTLVVVQSGIERQILVVVDLFLVVGLAAAQGLNLKRNVRILVLERLRMNTNTVSAIADTEVVITTRLSALLLVVVVSLNASIVILAVTRFGRTRVLLVRRRIIARIIPIPEHQEIVTGHVEDPVRNLHQDLRHRKQKLQQKQNVNAVLIALVQVLIAQIIPLAQEVKTDVLIQEHIPERSLEVAPEKIFFLLVLPQRLMLLANVYVTRPTLTS